MADLIASESLGAAPDSNSLAWQLRMIPTGSTWNAGRAVFQIGGGTTHPPMALPERPVYKAGLLTVGCTAPGYRITSLNVGFGNVVKPRGWWFPTNAEAPTQRIQLQVGLAKPGYLLFLEHSIRVRALVRCEYFPGLD